MRIGVMISYRGTMDTQQPWVDDTEDMILCTKHWAKCANEMIDRAKQDREPCQIEVFLFLRWGFWHEYRTLRLYLKLVHQYTWLANELYLVIDRRFGKESEYVIDSALIEEWFFESSRFSIDDILQTDVENLTEYDKKVLDKLKPLVNISRRRRRILDEMTAQPKEWEYEVLWSFEKLNSFIGILGGESVSGVQISDRIIIIEGNWKNCRLQSQAALKKIAGEKVLAICGTNVDVELEEYAGDLGIRLLKFSGYFDIRYFLQMYYLLRTENLKSPDYQTAPFPFSINEILIVESEKIFGNSSSSGNNASLISSAFDPGNFDLYNHLLNPRASRALFELFDGQRENKFVLPIVTTEYLSEHLEEMPANLQVWVHFGHGKKDGLQSFDKEYPLTEDWIESFRGKGKSLKLAFFFSCESDEVARKFAECGVKIAVGFGHKVTMVDCIKLAKIIVPLVLNGEDVNKIVKEFEKRCELLGEDYVKKCKPCIFISK